MPAADVTQIDFPSELVHQILLELCKGCWQNREYGKSRLAHLNAEKSRLVHLTAVCRHWARTLRPVLWESAVVKRFEHYCQLLCILDSGQDAHPSLSACVHTLYINYINDADERPWFHHLPSLSSRFHEVKLHLVLDNKQGIVGCPTRMLISPVSRYLPSTISGSVVPSLRSLSIQFLQVRNRAQLARIVDSLPYVTYYSFFRLSMEDCSPTLATRPRRTAARRAVQTLTILTVQCLDGTVFDQLDLSAIVRDPRAQFPLENILWTAIDGVIRAFFPIGPVPAVQTDYLDNGSVCSIQMDGEGVPALLGVRLVKSKEAPNRLARITLQLEDRAFYRRDFDFVNWPDLEDALRGLLHVPSIEIAISGERDRFKNWLVASVSLRLIFSNTNVMKKLDLSYWSEADGDYVVSSLSSLIA